MGLPARSSVSTLASVSPTAMISRRFEAMQVDINSATSDSLIRFPLGVEEEEEEEEEEGWRGGG